LFNGDIPTWDYEEVLDEYRTFYLFDLRLNKFFTEKYDKTIVKPFDYEDY